MPASTATTTPKSQPRIITVISQHRSYAVGIIVGLSLIAINVYVGLYMLTMILDDKDVQNVPGISLPVIYMDDYQITKKDKEARSVRQLEQIPPGDPFHTR